MNLPRRARLRRRLSGLTFLVLLLALCGCQTIGFYSQAIKGQYQIVFRQQRIEKLLADPRTPARLKARLQLVQDLRAFAEHDLKLPVDGHYRRYADLDRPYVVWNVQAAPEFSLEPKTWWYPFVGSLEYRGYFSESAAKSYGQRLRSGGEDVYVGGVTAYSTLGWFKDPVLNTFLFEPDADLAETIFHELGHQRVFAKGDTDFNEAFATTVGQEGARRWLRSRGDPAALESFSAQAKHTAEFVGLVARTRDQLAALYGDQRTVEGFRAGPAARARANSAERLRQDKQHILDRLQSEYAQSKAAWGGVSEYDGWFAHPINNAKLNSVAAYYDLVPGFERLLASNGGDLDKFYEAAARLAKTPEKERHKSLMDVVVAAGAAGP